MRLHPEIRGAITRTSRNATLGTAVIAIGGLYLLVTSRFAPALAPVAVWWPLEIVGWIVVLLALLSTWTTLGWWTRPQRHPAIERLAKWGDLDERMAALVGELDGARERHGTATFTASHLIVETAMFFAAIPTEQIVWCWVTETEHRKYGLFTVRRSYQVTLALRGGELVAFPVKAHDHENVLLCVAQRPGNHVVGADEALAKLWREQPGHVAAAVDRMAAAGRLEEGPHLIRLAAQAAWEAEVRAHAESALLRARETAAEARRQVAEARGEDPGGKS